jgi:hypothetical protein
MAKVSAMTILDQFLDPLADCLTKEAATRILQLSLDPQTQARIDELARKANEGELSSEEREEYAEFVEGIDLIGILKAKARLVLARNRS